MPPQGKAKKSTRMYPRYSAFSLDSIPHPHQTSSQAKVKRED